MGTQFVVLHHMEESGGFLVVFQVFSTWDSMTMREREGERGREREREQVQRSGAAGSGA